MKRLLKRAFGAASAVLLLSSVLLSLISCNPDRSYDEGEVLSAASQLIKQSEILNTVYYGNGISYREAGYTNGAYSEADSFHLFALGFDTVEELKRLTEKTYTVGYSLQLYSTVLTSITDDDNLYTMARYYQQFDPDDPTKPICIMVYREYDHIFEDKLTYDYSTLRVSGVKGEKVYVTLNAEVESKKGDKQTVEIDVSLIEEESGWRIDGPTWANYNEDIGKYEDLNKNNK